MQVEGNQIKAWSASSREEVKRVPPTKFLSKFINKSIDLQLYSLEPWFTLQNPYDKINGTGPNSQYRGEENNPRTGLNNFSCSAPVEYMGLIPPKFSRLGDGTAQTVELRQT